MMTYSELSYEFFHDTFASLANQSHAQLLAAHVHYESMERNQIGNCMYLSSDHQEIPTGGRLWHLIPSLR